MKVIMLRRVPRWYLGFALFFFLTIALIPGIMALTAVDPNKPQPIFHGNTASPKVAFACNVFWGEEFIPDMLDTFDRYNIKITFFIGGSWAKRHPEVLKMIAARGHEIGNHTYSHPHPNSISREQNIEQITRAEDLIKELTGIKTSLYAPPYGEYNDMVLKAAADTGYTTIMWSIDTIDWKRPPEDVLINRVMKKVHNGAIILMHPTDPTNKAMPKLVQDIQAKGYTISTVSSILN
jgi:probable sporulation protein (polysaccharide deacetylase family)